MLMSGVVRSPILCLSVSVVRLLVLTALYSAAQTVVISVLEVTVISCSLHFIACILSIFDVYLLTVHVRVV